MPEITKIRKLTGLSQSKFAKKYHIKLNTLQKWEQGVNETPDCILFLLNELLKYEGYYYEETESEGK